MSGWNGFDEQWLEQERKKGNVRQDCADRDDVRGKAHPPPSRDKTPKEQLEEAVKEHGKSTRTKRHDREHQAQKALIERCEWKKAEYPELEMLFAVPNGGHRHAAVGAKMKAEGVKAGVPDLFLPVPRGGWNGLVIEFKVDGGTVSDEQQWWIIRLFEQHYCTAVCYGTDEAWETIESYLNEEL